MSDEAGVAPQPRAAPPQEPAAGPAGLPGSGDGARPERERYEALVEYAPDAIVILDLDVGRFVTVNRAAEELFGMTRAELLRVGPAEVSPPLQPDGRSSQAAAMDYLGRALAGERPRFEWTHRRSDGVDLPCEVRLLRLPDPDRRLVRGSVLDVSERRAAGAARRDAAAAEAARRAAEASAAQLQALVAGLNAILWERDPRTLRIRFINARAEELLGYPTAQWLRDPGLAQRILHPDDREAALARVRKAVAEDTDFTMSYRAQAADGHWLWLQHLGHVARDEAGRATALHAVLFDVTEQRRREQATALLAATGQALTAPGTVEQRLTAAAAAATAELADRAVVWLRGDDDRYRIVAAAPADAAAGLTGVPLLVIPSELRRRVDAGRPFVVDEVTADLRRAATDGEPGIPADPVAGPRMLVPLVAGGERVGLLTLAAATPGRRYDDADLGLAGELGRRLAAMVDAERQADRERQLHELAVALAAAGTAAEAGAALTAGLQKMLNAAVVAVCAIGDDAQLHTVDVHGDSPTWASAFTTIRLSAPVPLAEAALTRRPVWLTDREALLARYPAVARFLRPETQATASLPLLVGHRLVGAVAVVFHRPRAFDAAERTLLLTVAGQVAAALERAALADVRREMAETLQRSLLPTRLPATDRLTVLARYLPAVGGTQAGGDWYDVVSLAGDCLALVVGDVVGHGATAAAVMGRLSSALSSLLLAGHRPAQALELLDRWAARIDGSGLATVACLLLDTGNGRLTYSTAGHPPPLLAAPERRVSFLDAGHGPALGLPGTGRRPEATTTLPPGATLLLYTDGLVERHDAVLDDGLRRLSTAAAALRTSPLPALVDGVLADLLDRDGADDDVALLAARLRPAPLRADLPADAARLADLRRAVSPWARQAALSADATEDLQLALGEAVANAVEHAYQEGAAPGRVVVQLDAEPDGGVRAAVTDGGTWQPAAVDPGFRGRGLGIIATLTSELDVSPGPAGTTLRFRMPPRTPVPGVPAPRRPAPPRAPARLSAREVDGRRHLQLLGDLDLAGVQAVRADLLGEAAGGRPIVLDLTRLGFLASIGAALLLETAQVAGDLVEVILPPAGAARRPLDLAGLTGLLTAQGATPAG